MENKKEPLMSEDKSIGEKSFNWISIYLKKPKDGQIVASRISNEQGYVGECIYKNGYFETYKDHRNRIEITRWKHDEWAEI